MSTQPFPAEFEPRRCPACGSRVADQATTCLMCGAPLVEEVPPLEEAPPARPWRTLLLGGIVLLLLAGGGFLWSQQNRPAPVPTATPTPLATPTVTRTPTPSLTPTNSPTPTFTPTPLPPKTYQVQEGDTLASIAVQFGTTVEVLLAYNPHIQDPNQLQVGQWIAIPAPTPTLGPTATVGPGTPSPTPPDFVTYVVQRGDTLISIAQKFGTTPDLIQKANRIQDPTKIQAGQALVIPLVTPGPSPTPTIPPNATPTPQPTYSAPAPLSPPDGAVIQGTDPPVVLQWAAVTTLDDDEWYVVHLTLADDLSQVWRYPSRTSTLRLPEELYPVAEVPEKRYFWSVTVMRQVGLDEDGMPRYEAVSRSSPSRAFTWIYVPPTPTPASP